MNFSWPRETIVYVIAACSVFACATGSTSPSGGGGENGEGGDSWGGSGSSSSVSGSGSSGSSGSSGGMTTCDKNSIDCSSCGSCSRTTGLCVSQYDDCLANSDCVAFATCISECPDGDTLCYSDCESFYPVGLSLFDVYAECVVCTDCYVNCDGASSSCN